MVSVPPIPARNRRIGEFLKELRLAEGRGTGLPKIRRRMAENGSPEPQFDFDEGRSYFRVILPAHPRYKVIHAIREGALLWSTGERQSALDHLNRAYETQRQSGALASRLIDYLASSNDLPAAEHIFDLFASQPVKTESAQPYLAYAKALLDMNNPARARSVLNELPFPGSTEDKLETAILLKRSRDFRAAHSHFVQMQAEMQDDPKFLHEFAQTKIALARLVNRRDIAAKQRLNRDAEELLRRAIQLADDPTRQAWCWFELARTLRWLRASNTEVEQAFLTAISLRPEETHFERVYQQWKERQH